MNLGQKNIKTIMLAAAMLLCSVVFAQYSGLEDFEKTKLFYNNFSANKSDLSNLDSAKKYIEKAFIDDLIKKDGSANNLQGVIYKEIYKAREISNYKSAMRKAASLCFLQSIKVDTSHKNTLIAKQQLNWIAAQYNNDSKRALEKFSDFDAAIDNFAQFKLLKFIVDTSFSFKLKELEFELALASLYQEKGLSTGKKELLDLAKVTYLIILEKDSLNGDANFNLATMYYNRGANLILNMNFDTPLDSVSIIDEMSIKLFKQSTPFMLRAFSSKPNCLKILEGLKGIFNSIRDEEKIKYYTELYDKLKVDIELGNKKEDC